MPTPETFITRWNGIAGSERSNYQLFIIELCELLELPRPEPAGQTHSDNSYVFERHLKEHALAPLSPRGRGAGGEGDTGGEGEASPRVQASNRFIDCYRRGSFVLEAKGVQQNRETQGAKIALRGAHGQAQNYARSLPSDETRPPFLIIIDVGDVIELYSEFSRSGGAYLPYPDPGSHRIRIPDLNRPEIRERLRQVWLDPMALDPTRISAKVTRKISADLALLAKSLEQAGHDTHEVAGFLTRCLFTLFAEDVALLPRQDGKGGFTALLESLADAPEQFEAMVSELWQKMDSGGFSIALRAKLPRFNGKFFKNPTALALNREQITLLLRAAHADWTLVEPAIFGTLLERALDPSERHSLGAHYTPRAYVERLVLPTVMEPLRAEWANIQAAALLLDREGRAKEAQQEIRAFHYRLCNIRVLDPACGSANFLYVTMEHMKRLEGEVLDLLQDLGASGSLDAEGLTVDPHQFLGIELNPRAAAIAELVLWIGHLQWHFRTKGASLPPEPVLRDFHNIECRDAVLNNRPSPLPPDKTHRPSPLPPLPLAGEGWGGGKAGKGKPADWPEADYIIGNPPFIGASAMRAALGDAYVDALRAAYPEVPESADLVMFWWHKAAALVTAGKAQRFGFITTNSLRQTFNRRVLEAYLSPSPTLNPSPPAPPPRGGRGEKPLSLDGRGVGERVKMLHLAFAIPDHPWVENSGGAAVRIAMTVGVPSPSPSPTPTPSPGGRGEQGCLLTVTDERSGSGEGLEVTLAQRVGVIHADLSIGANVAGALGLRANEGLANRGFQLFGSGFIVTPEQAAQLETDAPIKPYRNGRDLTDRPRGVKLIDLYGHDADEVRRRWPATYQWVLERVKPERDLNNRASYRDNWWIFGEPRKVMRATLTGLPRYIATVETAKHRVFQFLDAEIAPDNKLICIALDDAYWLGVLSSQVHVIWALAQGGTLEDRPRYNKSRCFETFPFPDLPPPQPSPGGRGGNGQERFVLSARIRSLAEQLDAHRKRVLAEHPELTLTGLYNVLEKLRTGADRNAKEQAIYEKGLVAVLKSFHDDLDAAVLQAYGWSDLDIVGCNKRGALHQMPPAQCPLVIAPYQAGGEGGVAETILERLVALNTERAAEEAQGQIRWLRPAYQHPQAAPQQQQLNGTNAETPMDSPLSLRGRVGEGVNTGEGENAQSKSPWPAELPAQMAAIAQILSSAGKPLSESELAEHFSGKGAWKKRLPQLLETLVALGRAVRDEQGRVRVVAG
ncbi:MAG: hypothetical protein Q8O37_06900 [Sulfuricellaceae bacterium]|nr:hypothetical protein [Sulfuricellaceae bacterium]